MESLEELARRPGMSPETAELFARGVRVHQEHAELSAQFFQLRDVHHDLRNSARMAATGLRWTRRLVARQIGDARLAR